MNKDRTTPCWRSEVDLSVSYGKVEALSNASLTVGEGQIVTVIGPNGAGKTTMLSAIMGVLGSKGQVAFDGSMEACPKWSAWWRGA
jgi:branched-chain amino acid transport system ATP-binding protein